MLELLKAEKGFDEIEEAFKLYEKIMSSDDASKSDRQSKNCLIEKSFLGDFLSRYENLSALNRERLFWCLEEIEGNPEILALYKFLRWDLCRYKKGIDGWFYQSFDFDYESRYPDCRKFILLLSCISEGRKDLIKRNIPVEVYEEMPHKVMAGHIAKYEETGNCEMLDFPWDKNFYAGTIFLFDRFYFTPYTFSDPFYLYRNENDGKVTGLYKGNFLVNAEGQVMNPEFETPGPAMFATKFNESIKFVTGNFINPVGIISESVRTLNLEEETKCLQEGDLLLAFHIPGGEGYNPVRLERSMRMALDFYDKYFPELDIRGFWSESWLYDPKLSLILDEDTNIVRMQRRFYCYPIGEGGDMLLKELKPFNEPVEKRSSLQKKAAYLINNKTEFHTTSMIVLREDVEGIKDGYTYVTERDIREYRELLKKNGKGIPDIPEVK
ncbi:MAG: hypothetical protein K6D96_04750 [Acetatifactor sp.]|nr:hypothetical protein [Acetatifactor sp.]